MGRVIASINPDLAAWIDKQHMFFVATAPLDGDGRVNLSPKGFAGSFVILGPHEVAYLDRIGSGVETIAHLRENQRITVMFCAFEGKPDVVRLHGKGTAVLVDEPGFADLIAKFPEMPRGTRSIIRVAVERVSASCGFGVPFMDYVDERETMTYWTSKKSDEALAQYVVDTNARSIDGLPAIDPA